VSSGQLSKCKKARSKSSSERPAVSVSVKPLHAANDNLIDQTRQVWQPRIGRDLSHEGARQIKEDVVGFFSILAEWSRAEMPAPANDPGGPASDDKEARHEG
jgi:hypothetical protein